VIGAVLLATTVASAIEPTATRPLAQRNPARKRRMRVKVPKPPRTFLEMDELVSLIDAAGARDALIARAKLPATPRTGSTAAKAAERWEADMPSDLEPPRRCAILRLHVEEGHRGRRRAM